MEKTFTYMTAGHKLATNGLKTLSSTVAKPTTNSKAIKALPRTFFRYARGNE